MKNEYDINKTAMRIYEKIFSERAEALGTAQECCMAMGCGDEDWSHFVDDWHELEFEVAEEIEKSFKINKLDVLSMKDAWEFVCDYKFHNAIAGA